MFSSSLLRLEFDREPAIYYGSELLTGIVHLTTNDTQLYNRQLSVKLVGEVAYEVVVRRNNEKHHEIPTVVFLSENVVLNQSSADQQKCIISDGRRSWPFEIELPTHAPPTFEILHLLHKNHPAVTYSVVACL